MGTFEERCIYRFMEITIFCLRFKDVIYLIWIVTADQLMKLKQQVDKV